MTSTSRFISAVAMVLGATTPVLGEFVTVDIPPFNVGPAEGFARNILITEAPMEGTKFLNFVGFASNPSNVDQLFVVSFGVDSTLPGEFRGLILAGAIDQRIEVHSSISPCPPEVAFDFFVPNVPGVPRLGVTNVRGTLTYECVIPEPSSLALVSMGAIGGVVVAWRRGRAKSA